MRQDPRIDRLGGGVAAAAEGAVGLPLHGLEHPAREARSLGEAGGVQEAHGERLNAGRAAHPAVAELSIAAEVPQFGAGIAGAGEDAEEEPKAGAEGAEAVSEGHDVDPFRAATCASWRRT